MLKIKLLYPDVIYPNKAHKGDAGYDVYAREAIILHPNAFHKFSLGFAIIGEPGKVYIVAGKSGLSQKGITTIGNIIDNGYRGEVAATLVNVGNQIVYINKGDKIAQILVQNVEDDQLIELYHGELDQTERGSGGFGSTGI